MHDVSTDGRLVLDGALTVRNAGAIHDTLCETIMLCPIVSIDCAAADEVDLSFIQLLVAMRVSASAAGKTVTLSHPGGALLDALTRGGFRVTHENPADAGAFWFDGAAE